MPQPPEAKLTAAQWRLLALLSVATFFEGWDAIALTQVLPELRLALHLQPSDAGWLVGLTNIGTVLAFWLVRQADRWGRRKAMLWTLSGYTVMTALSGLAPDVWTLGAAQTLAKMFLIGEWALSMVYAAEEFPAHRRATILGIVQAVAALGSVACAGLAPLLLKAPTGWRTVYLVGSLPAAFLLYLRRNLPETRRFAELGPQAGPSESLWAIWRTGYRLRVVQLALVWSLVYACTQATIAFWKEFAVTERGFTDKQVGGSVAIAAVAAMPLVFLAGRMIDAIGRRWGATVIFLVAGLGTWAAFSLHGRWPLTLAMVGGIFAASAVLPVLNAWTTELFPTAQRGAAFAWANNLLGRVGYVGGPIAVGLAADRVGWGAAAAWTAVGPALAIACVWAWLPETKGRALEETSRLG